jgi:murein DD-endopeptidase MepM/ murein hydrolase activator NlpD
VVLWLPLPACAEGVILDAGTAGETGMQADMAVVSARPALSRVSEAAWQTYVVEPGDTLASVAARLQLNPTALAAQNGLSDTVEVQPGQVLRTGYRLSAQSGPIVHGPLAQVQFWPWPPLQGQTLIAWLRVSPAVTLTATFAGQPCPVTMDGERGWVFVPVHPLMAPGVQPLVLTSGQATTTLAIPVQAGDFPSDTVPPSTADPILSQPQKVQVETTRLSSLFAGVSSFGWTPHSRFQSPLEGEYPHTSPFGTRRIYGSDADSSYHAGEDFAAPAGTPVLAPAPGTVVLAELLFVRGNAVVIDHGHGVFTGYWHMSVLDVKVGDKVTAGQQLGEVGSTGMSTGAHLHWELRIGGVSVDPLQWLVK